MKRQFSKSCLTLFVLLLTLAIIFWIIIRKAPYQLSSNVSPEIDQITGQANLIVQRLRTNDTLDGKVQQYKIKLENGDLAYFDVDAKQNVTGYFLSGHYNQKIVLTLDQAVEIARDFAIQHYPDKELIKQIPDNAILIAGNEGRGYFNVSWTKYDEIIGARLPQTAQVQVSAESGDIIGFQRLFLEYSPRIRPEISKADASIIASELMKNYFSQPAIISTELVVTKVPVSDPKDELVLVWFVRVQGALVDDVIPEAMVIIEAVTGELIEVVPIQ